VTPTPTSQHHSSGSSDTKCETVDLAPRIGAWYGPAAAQYSVGDGPLQLDPERRAARRFLRPSARGELQTTGKPRTVGRVWAAAKIRPLAALRSRVYDLSRARAARPVRCGRVNRPPEVQIGRRRDQLGSTTATESQRGRPLARWPAAIDGELGAGRRAALPLWWVRGAGCCCARRALGGPGARQNALARALTTRPLGTAGARCEGGRPARRVWPRGSRTRPPGRAAGTPTRAGAGVDSSRCAALPPTRI
jgi:hypothetical protein